VHKRRGRQEQGLGSGPSQLPGGIEGLPRSGARRGWAGRIHVSIQRAEQNKTETRGWQQGFIRDLASRGEGATALDDRRTACDRHTCMQAACKHKGLAHLVLKEGLRGRQR